MKYLIVLVSPLFFFACAQEKTPTVENPTTQTATPNRDSESILPPNEKTLQAEQDFANELNTLLHTVEETPNE